MSTSTEIYKCPKCKGTGKLTESKLVCHHNGDYDYRDKVCDKCNGACILEDTTTITVTTKPYKPTPEKLNKKWH